MKTIIFLVLAVFAPILIVTASDTNSPDSKAFQFTNSDRGYSSTNVTGLVSFFPDLKLADISRMAATNGVNSDLIIADNSNVSLRPPYCVVSVYNHGIDVLGCLRMPATNLCRIALVDAEGHDVPKTSLGRMYGSPLSQEQVDNFFQNWRNAHERIVIRLIPNGIPRFADQRSDICYFSIRDAFEITKPGDYGLHVQLRLVQVGRDSSRKLHYPITWLPGIVAKVHITAEDLK